MTPTHPRLLPDRDKRFKWYLDEDVVIQLPHNSTLTISKGYRFDAHSVPFLLQLFFPKYNKSDVYCALIHDALVDFESVHRYNRSYIDTQYKKAMYSPEYYSSKWRAYWMTTAVCWYGFLVFTLWGDYRGEPKPGTRIEVRVTHV